MVFQQVEDISNSVARELSIEDNTGKGLLSWGDGLAEWTDLKAVFVHRPGIEMSLASLDFKTNLFQDVFYLEKAQKQHDTLCETLKDQNIDVISSEDLVKFLTPSDLEKFVKFNNKFTSNDKDELIHNYIEDHKQIDIILTQPEINRQGLGDVNLTNSFSIRNPLGNFFYSRDPIFQTGKNEFVLGNLKYQVRKREIDVIKLLFDQINHLNPKLNPEITYTVSENETIEGGEVIPLGDTMVVGVESHRTTIGSVYDLMNNNAIGHSKIAIVISPVKTQEEMHIDTWFNVIDEDLFVGADRFFSNGIDLLLYERDPDKGVYKLNKEHDEFLTYLTHEMEMNYLPLNDREQKDLMSNGLTIGSRKYIMIDGKATSSTFDKKLEKQNVDVIPVELDELTEGHGGAHCMTQPLLRDMDKNYQ